jgi:uncharacterized protein YidB (DUF937 family)
MGLLDSVIGALGQAQGGGGGQADLLGAVVGMLGQGGGVGGLGGLVEKFTQGGLGDVVNSWVSTGQNLPVSAEQLSQVLGSDTLAGLARQLGMGEGELGTQLSQLLPQVVDKLTPNGQLPGVGQGAGGLGDLAGMLGGLMRR